MNPNLIVLKRGHIPFLSQRKTTRENFKLWLNSTYMMILFFIWFLWIYYVWTLNVNATKWYNIRNLEIEKKDLTIKKELIDIKVAELESLSHIMKQNLINDMVKVENQDFLVIKDNLNYAFNK